MRFGRSVPKGFLPVYRCESEAEARALLTVACGTNIHGEYVARELAHEQTLENLEAFSIRLEQVHQELRRRRRARR